MANMWRTHCTTMSNEKQSKTQQHAKLTIVIRRWLCLFAVEHLLIKMRTDTHTLIIEAEKKNQMILIKCAATRSGNGSFIHNAFNMRPIRDR